MHDSNRRWFVNLDAELELERPQHYQASRAITALALAQRPALARLTGGEPLFTWNDREAARSSSGVVFCWCPTPAARQALSRWGCSVVPGPALDVLQRVNHRRFQLQLPGPFERRFAQLEPDQSDAEWDPLSTLGPGRWRCKRPFGFAGRGQRVLAAPLSDDDRRWLRDSLRLGLLVEPELEVREEWCVHGALSPSRLLIGQACRQWCDAFGRVVRIEPAEPSAPVAGQMTRSARDVAQALTSAGYFGPFGIDGFVYEANGIRVCNAVSDVNARFTLGWSIGMGSQREAALRLLADGT